MEITLKYRTEAACEISVVLVEGKKVNCEHH